MASTGEDGLRIPAPGTDLLPKEHYRYLPNASLAEAGYTHLAEIGDCGHAAAFCHIVTSQSTPIPNFQLDLAAYNSWVHTSRESLQLVTSVVLPEAVAGWAAGRRAPDLAARVAEIQQTLAEWGVREGTLKRTGIAVSQATIGGQTRTVVTVGTPWVHDLLKLRGPDIFAYGEELGSAPMLLKSSGKIWRHVERAGIGDLEAVGATEGYTATYPLRCDICEDIWPEKFADWIHLTPKPTP
jgi:hypothetical protein